uniref:Calpain catalytic domain-containing protein n=1 Tax=Steinernema glaseri TaxID=37863 RepID=A0A1I7Z1K7_9BILA
MSKVIVPRTWSPEKADRGEEKQAKKRSSSDLLTESSDSTFQYEDFLTREGTSAGGKGHEVWSRFTAELKLISGCKSKCVIRGIDDSARKDTKEGRNGKYSQAKPCYNILAGVWGLVRGIMINKDNLHLVDGHFPPVNLYSITWPLLQG